MTYMHDFQQYVRIGSEMLGMRKSTHGGPQGPILWPALFNVYIDDLLGVPKYCSFESYVAEDSKLHISFLVKEKDIYGAARQITEDLKKVASWWSQNTSLRINPHKTKLLLIGTRRKLQNAPWDLDLQKSGVRFLRRRALECIWMLHWVLMNIKNSSSSCLSSL